MCARVRGRWVAIALALMLPAVPLGAGEALTLRVTPGVAFAPATVVITTAAQQDKGNRGLKVELESDEYYRCSFVQLDGADAAQSTIVRYEGVPGGEYEARATLLGAGGQKRAAAARTVQVFANGGR